MATADLSPHETHEQHDERVAHHFESAQQQFDAGKLGMWLFLVTEVLFFSGLFVAYAVYRSNHPEVFVNAHKYLNTTLGAFNTIVLLVSSLTMAWAVRSAQLNQQRALIGLLATTLACASLFLGVKAVEYSHKWDQGLLWAGAYTGGEETHTAEHAKHKESSPWLSKSLERFSIPFAVAFVGSAILFAIAGSRRKPQQQLFWLCIGATAAAYFLGVVFGQFVESVTAHSHEPAAASALDSAASNATAFDGSTIDDDEQRKFTGVFFSIYYAMTGVHALHIFAGMGVISWILWRAIKHEFDGDYFGPVDYVALYWHLVDLVWVYLFPLLYLIR